MSLLLQRVDHLIVSGSTHLDFKVRDVSKAIAEIEAIGGKLRKSARLLPQRRKSRFGVGCHARPLGNAFLHPPLAGLAPRLRGTNLKQGGVQAHPPFRTRLCIATVLSARREVSTDMVATR